MLKKLVIIIIQTHLTLESSGRSCFFAKKAAFFARLSITFAVQPYGSFALCRLRF